MSSEDPRVGVALEASGDYIWDWNLHTGELFLSDNWLAVTGYAASERPLTYESWVRLVSPADLPAMQDALLSHIAGQHARYRAEYWLVRADGALLLCQDRGRIVARDDAGRPLRIAGTGSAMDARLHADADFGPRNRLLQTIIDLVPDLLYIKDLNRRKILTNRADRWYMGLEGEAEALGKLDEEVFTQAEAAHFRQQDEAVLAGQTVRNVEEQISVGGQPRWLLTTKVPLVDTQGTIIGLVGVGRDITELHAAKAELEQMTQTLEARVAERAASLAEAQRIAHLGSWELDLATHRVTLSDEGRRILGIDPSSTPVSLADILAVLHTTDQVVAVEAMAEAMQSAAPGPQELRLVRRDGTSVYIATRAQVVIEDGAIVRIIGTMQDITERKLGELDQRRLTAIIEATTDLIGTTDHEGNSVYLNQGGRLLLGIAPDADISNLNVASFYSQAVFERLHSEIIPGVVEHGVWTGENLVRHMDGHEIPVSQVVLCHRDHEGTVAYLSTIVRDITPQREAAEALRQSRDELQAANKVLEKAARMKDEFLANMSHELRTPLTGILGMAEALQSQTYGTLNERQLRSLHLVEQSGRHLLDLINNILDLSKIEAGQFEIHKVARQLSDICRASMQIVAGLVQQKGQSLQFSMEPDSIEIVADPRRLKQMLTNLLGNAAKFTPEGGALGLRVRGDERAGLVHIIVWDTGVGIVPEDLGKLFQPFTQLDSSLTRRHAGTGLGLSLVKRMAELHGGYVQVESTPGAGSEFVLTLPWSPSPAAADRYGAVPYLANRS